ncbi:hypothetical protein [Halospeciosus flavus]|uniref:hypothetical protein n=1 Tax=Halospeciosus flavus TaxID=3032283 RepID=UPI003612DE85
MREQLRERERALALRVVARELLVQRQDVDASGSSSLLEGVGAPVGRFERRLDGLGELALRPPLDVLSREVLVVDDSVAHLVVRDDELPVLTEFGDDLFDPVGDPSGMEVEVAAVRPPRLLEPRSDVVVLYLLDVETSLQLGDDLRTRDDDRVALFEVRGHLFGRLVYVFAHVGVVVAVTYRCIRRLHSLPRSRTPCLLVTPVHDHVE